jgi:hypothetical protein
MKTFPTFPLQAPADEGKGGAGGGGAVAPAAGAGAGSGAPPAGAGAGGDPKAAAGAAGKGDPSPGANAGQQKGDAGKPGDGEKPTTDKPTKLELKLPEGTKLDEATWGKFEPIFQKAGLNSEQASELATVYTQLQKEQATAQTQAWDQIRDSWNKELRADKEFGGANYDANAALAAKAVVRFGGKELSDQLAKYGVDNLPLLAKAFAKVGAAIKEDSSSTETAGNPSTSKPLSHQERKANFYAGENKR